MKSIEAVVRDVMAINPPAGMVIKSTLLVGYTVKLKAESNCDNSLFAFEFLREGRALHDNSHSLRIVVVGRSKRAQASSSLLQEGTIKQGIPILLSNSTGAEAIKLFANTYLAMRLAHFSELDTYAGTRGQDTQQIFDGVCLDSRISKHYPGFGCGGYWQPKNTRQLLAEFEQVPQNPIHAIVDANTTHKDFIADQILKRQPRVLGLCRLIMKSEWDNFRASSIQEIMKPIKGKGIDVIAHGRAGGGGKFYSAKVITDLGAFKHLAGVIITNRNSEVLVDLVHKVYIRDLFGSDS